MSREAVEMLLDKWINEPAWREEVRVDPEAAIRATGAELDQDEWAALRDIDWSLSDEELLERASKAA